VLRIPTNKQKLLKNIKQTMTVLRSSISTRTSVENDAKAGLSDDMKEQICMSPMMTGGSTTKAASTHSDDQDDDEACPGMSETSSVKSSSEEEEEEHDTFALDSAPMPRISSSTIPIFLEVAPRTGGFDTKDPLFGGVCLYSGSMASEQRDKFESPPDEFFEDEESSSPSTDGGLSWLLRIPSKIFSSTP
jgi:hypothetical protein